MGVYNPGVVQSSENTRTSPLQTRLQLLATDRLSEIVRPSHVHTRLHPLPVRKSSGHNGEVTAPPLPTTQPLPPPPEDSCKGLDRDVERFQVRLVCKKELPVCFSLLRPFHSRRRHAPRHRLRSSGRCRPGKNVMLCRGLSTRVPVRTRGWLSPLSLLSGF